MWKDVTRYENRILIAFIIQVLRVQREHHKQKIDHWEQKYISTLFAKTFITSDNLDPLIAG